MSGFINSYGLKCIVIITNNSVNIPANEILTNIKILSLSKLLFPVLYFNRIYDRVFSKILDLYIRKRKFYLRKLFHFCETPIFHGSMHMKEIKYLILLHGIGIPNK